MQCCAVLDLVCNRTDHPVSSWLQSHATYLETVLQGGIEWGVPEVVAGLPDGCGIASISAGARASAAVTSDNKLWMWGRLMAADNARWGPVLSACRCGCGRPKYVLTLLQCT